MVRKVRNIYDQNGYIIISLFSFLVPILIGSTVIFGLGQVLGDRFNGSQTWLALHLSLAEVELSRHSRNFHGLCELADLVPLVLHWGDVVTAILVEKNRAP